MKIIVIEDNRVIRFVENYRTRKWFRKEKIEYTYDVLNAMDFLMDQDTSHIEERIRKDFPNAIISTMDFEEFVDKHWLHRFFVIGRWNERKDVFYEGTIKRGEVIFTEDIMDASIMLSESVAKDTLQTIQRSSQEKVYVRTIYLSLINELLTPKFMITCTGKKSDGTRYFKKLDGRRVRLVATSFAASKYDYESVIELFKHLRIHNRNYLYAVLPAFKDNVHADNIEEYMKTNKVSRQVVMDLKLKNLNL